MGHDAIRQWMWRGVAVGGLVLAVGCGGVTGSVTSDGNSGSSGGDSSVGITTVDQLPLATSPVVASSSTSLAAKSLAKATTGLSFSGMSDESFSTDSSLAACEMASRFKQSINAAAQGDRILCYVKEVVAANGFSSAADVVYDGNFHVYQLAFTGAESTPSKVKMRIRKDANGRITDFTMMSCDAEQGSGSLVQSEFIQQAISGTDFTMVSKGIWERMGDTGSYQVDVSGTLNADGQFVGTKRIVDQHVQEGQWSGFGSATTTQTSTTLGFSGYISGTYAAGNDRSENVNRVVAAAQLIDGNSAGADYNIGLLAMGDGAAHAILSGEGTWQGGSFSFEEDVTQGWNGDTLLVDESAAADYLDDVAGDPPVAGSQPSISFAADETFDCSEAADFEVTGDIDAIESACSHLSLGYSWLDCWNTIARDDE